MTRATSGGMRVVFRRSEETMVWWDRRESIVRTVWVTGSGGAEWAYRKRSSMTSWVANGREVTKTKVDE